MFGIKKKAKKRTVLFVHDDVLVLQSLERSLIYTSYNKLFARSSEEALEITQQEDVHLIVANMCIPEMTGLELFRAVRKESPRVIGIILTGYEEDEELQNAVQQGEILKFVSKPWKFGLADLKSLVRRTIEDYNLQLKR
jgi:response regulator RpfG family c-di-GMP phosphodiesterase